RPMHLRAAISSSALVHAGILAALWCYAPQPPRPKVHYAVARGAPVTLQVTVAAKAATPAASEKRPPEPAEPEEPDAAEIESIRTPDRRVEASAARVAAMQPAARASPP